MAAGESPQTFEARGAIAQYCNRALKLVRLRPAKSGRPKDMEAVVPNSDSGGRGYLILPFAKVPEFTQLDARDSAMQYEIKAASALNTPDPFVLRSLRLKVDQKHGATDAIKAAAEREIETDKTEKFRIRLALIAQLTRDCGTRMGDRFMASASTERLLEFVQKKEIGGIRIDVDELTKRVVHLTGQAIGAQPVDVEKRLEKLIDLAAPFGTPGVPTDRKTDGFLIRQRHSLARLVASLKEARQEVRAAAMGAIDKAEPRVVQTLGFVDERLNAVDGLFADLTRALKDWDMTLSRLQQARRSVAWGLDGWDQMVEAWDESKVMARKFESPEPLERNIAWIEQNMPILPRYEWDPNAALAIAEDSPIATAQPVKMMHGWRDGAMDEELARRLAKKS
jgi:hypothetical protein